MLFSIIYILLALFALSFLVFIHELGHYFVARREGMTIEAFSIGFGKPLVSWEKDGVKWQICWLPFGGYVRIAGMEKRGALEPYQIPDGFYGKKPMARIRVALMGPLVNIVFAFLLFTMIWISGGRQKPFSEYTHLIGWIDPHSKLYQIGVRPGDEITELNNHPFEGFNEFIYSAFLEEESPQIKGFKVDYATEQKNPFTFTLQEGEHLKGVERAASTLGVLNPASFLLYKKLPGGTANPLPEGSPIEGSGIEYNDRILWVDGELVFSQKQLVSLVNQPKALLTVQREGKVFLTRIPRVKISDLRITPAERSELEDWQFEAHLQSKVQDLYFIPYNLTPDCTVENAVAYVDDESYELKHKQTPRSQLDVPLAPGDHILAVDGQKIENAYECLGKLQERYVQVIVQRGTIYKPVSWKTADSTIASGVNFKDLQMLIDSIGTSGRLAELGDLCLLQPVKPKPVSDFTLSEATRTRLANEFVEQKKRIEKIDDPKERELALHLLEENQKKLILGIYLQDRMVTYNPSPFTLFADVFDETWRTLSALVSGYLSPKYMSGPVGIVHAIQTQWMVGFKEAMFWVAVISLNLGIINLLPIPVLDGGHICFAIWESITKKPIKAKTMEKFIIPFIVLLILFFVYLTYHDILRLVGKFF